MRRALALAALCASAAADDLVLEVGEPRPTADGAQVEVRVAWERSWRAGEAGDGLWLFAQVGTPGGWRTGRVTAAQVVQGDLEATPARDGAGLVVRRGSEGNGQASGRLRVALGDLGEHEELHLLGLELVRVTPASGPPAWLMKRELDQGAYAAFLDHLPTQATFMRSPTGGRTYGGRAGSLRREGTRYVAGRPREPCGFLSWEDGCAFADWAGLRPARADELAAGAGAQVLGLEALPWEPALRGEPLALTHGDGLLMREGRATHRDWTAGGVVLHGATGVAPGPSLTDRRPEVGFRAARTAPGTRTVLFVGGGGILAGDLPARFAELSRAAGVPRPAEVTLRARAGDRFERMATSQTLLDELASGRFELVLLQEDVAALGSARRGSEHARPLVEAARRGGATPILVMTWGFRDRPSVAFETAAANVTAWGAELGAPVAPLGLAWRRALTRDPHLALHDESGRDPSPAGAWLNACVLFHLLYGEPPAALVPAGDPALLELAGEVVRDYVQPH